MDTHPASSNSNKRGPTSPPLTAFTPKDPKVPRVTVPLSNDQHQMIIGAAASRFNSGDIGFALAIIIIMERKENPTSSMFAGLGWSGTVCLGLVANDAVLEQAVRDCFQNESLDPLREYS